MTVLSMTATKNLHEFVDKYDNEIESFYRGDDFIQVWFKQPIEVDMNRYGGFSHV